MEPELLFDQVKMVAPQLIYEITIGHLRGQLAKSVSALNKMNLNKFNIYKNLATIKANALPANLILQMHLDETHLDENLIEKMGWKAIHSENGGDMDSELGVLAKHLQSLEAAVLYATTYKHLQEVSKTDQFRSLRLANVDSNALLALQAGIMDAPQPQELIDAYLTYDLTFAASSWFDNPLTFVLLREHDGYGWTTIAGIPELIDSITTQALHGLYDWIEGVLPLRIAGGRDPSAR